MSTEYRVRVDDDEHQEVNESRKTKIAVFLHGHRIALDGVERRVLESG
jgi:hypothetical protein